MNELMAVVVTWLSYTVGLPANYDYPEVLVLPRERMIEAWKSEGGKFASQQSFLTTSESSSELQLFAFYADLTQTIYLDEQWSASSMASVSILVHEMAHHLQAKSELTYACTEEREQVAYEAQARWLEQSGLDLATVFELDPMSLLVRTQCMH